MLDRLKWYVHTYDDDDGTVLLVRGVEPQDELPSETAQGSENGPPDRVQYGAIKIRRGQKDFREKLLRAYGSTCAVTGCKIVDLLEAAHIRPYAEEPNYHISNGLLLRADIHTLYDLNLLSFDTRLRIHLAPALFKSEYKTYDGRELRHPSQFSDMPSLEYIEKRISGKIEQIILEKH